MGVKTTRYTAKLFTTLLLIFTGTLAFSQIPCGFKYCRLIKIDHTKVSGGADLTNFPVLVSTVGLGDESLFKLTPAGHVQNASGYDVVFTAADGVTPLNFQLENYVSGTGEYEAYVNIPLLSHSVDTYIYMYYDNSAISTNQSTTSTWDGNTIGVWHLDNSIYTDGTSNANNGTPNGVTSVAAGEIASAAGYNGTTTNYVQLGLTNASASNGTIELWGYINTYVASTYFFGHSSTQNATYTDRIQLYTSDAAGTLTLGMGNNHALTNIATLSKNTWYHIVLSWTGSGGNGTYIAYINGVQKATGSYTSLNTLYTSADAGNDGNAGQRTEALTGNIDEIHISKTQRTAGWITTDYNNQSSPSTFCVISTEPATWIGTTNANWSVGTNWSSGSVPASGANVIIANSASNQPSVNVNPQVGFIWVQSGATLTISGGNTLSVYNNIVTCGTTAGAGTGTLIMNTTGTPQNQYISGPGTYSLAKLTSNPAAVTDTIFLSSPIALSSSFTISTGVFACQANQITGTAGTMNMAASTTLLLGSKTVATAVNFPTGYVAGNINLTAGSTVVYQANTNQTISGTPNYANLTITGGTASTTNTLSSNVTVNGNLLIQDGTGVVTFSGSSFNINADGNFTDNGIFSPGTGTVTLNGSSGVQALSSTEAAGLRFYDLVVNNTSATYPGITTTANLNVSDQITYTAGNLDLKGNSFAITTAQTTNTTDSYTGGNIISSSAGAHFTVTDPNSILFTKLYGTWIGNQTIGITISVTSGEIEFENFTQYGTASFTKTGAFSNTFTGGNGFHGPVTFTANSTTGLWKFGVSTTLPDTFYNATVNAGANLTGNDNFIFGANNTETFNGTTTITSTTPGGVYIGRSNGTGSANITFNGPVVCNISLTGNVVFADAGLGNLSKVTFNSTITLNSTATSTGYYYFGNSQYSTVTLSATGQFTGSGTIQGHTNTYLENVTQNGITLTQTINTVGSDGKLLIGGTGSASTAQPNTFNATCNFTADTAGYIVNGTFNGATTFTVNKPGAFGYIISNVFNSTLTATVGDILFQNNTFNGVTSLQHTSTTTNSTTNGGNTFNAAATIINSGSTNLLTGTTAGDIFAANATFTQNSTGLIFAARTNTSTFAGNITVNGTSSSQMSFGSNNGGITINGSGTQVFATGGSAVVPAINDLTMNMTAAGTNILQFNLSPSFIITGTLTFNSGNTGLINLNTSTMILGNAAAPGTIAYPAPGILAGWIYGGTFTRWFAAGASILLPTGASVATAGFFPIGSSPALDYFQPFWFAAPATTVKTAGSIALFQNSNANWNTPLSPTYVDATWAGGTTVQGVSIADWQVTPTTLALTVANDADIMFGGFGFVTFITGDVNASYATSTAGTYAAPSQLYGATDIEVERTGLSLLQLNAKWYIGTSNTTTSPLPIKLLSFNAVYGNTENIVNVNWITASEINNKLFTVQRSIDGVTYDDITTVPGAGNSNQTLNYAAIDPNPIPGIDYYRLKQTDYDGTFSYSDVVPVNVTSSEVLTLFPNPVTSSSLMLSYYVPATAQMDVKIYDIAGQEMAAYSTTMEKGNNTFTIDASKFAGGVYILKAVIGNQTFVRKFVKQ
ncbi:MAG TPA: T9SS type A sorting domain-containing protein [Bacteroidia bacterium]|nr:T9SS type A sorting domain-containing protein [Bacteroidia bacterium]